METGERQRYFWTWGVGGRWGGGGGQTDIISLCRLGWGGVWERELVVGWGVGGRGL